MMTDSAALLRARGIQVTAQRLAVLRAVAGQPHITADAVAEVVRTEIGAISLQSVYDALGLLVSEGLIRRIQPVRIAGALRGSGRRQSPPPDLSNLRPRGRRRLRGRLRAVSHGQSTIGATRSTRPKSPTGGAVRIVWNSPHGIGRRPEAVAAPTAHDRTATVPTNPPRTASVFRGVTTGAHAGPAEANVTWKTFRSARSRASRAAAGPTRTGGRLG